MSDRPLINCPGCETVVDPARAACPGCGRCLNCGRPRASSVSTCADCGIPYCECCGRCPQCLELRYSDVEPCDCGHPNDESRIEELVRYEAVIGAEKRKESIGCWVAMIAALALFLGGVAAVVNWFVGN